MKGLTKAQLAGIKVIRRQKTYGFNLEDFENYDEYIKERKIQEKIIAPFVHNPPSAYETPMMHTIILYLRHKGKNN